MTQRYWSLSAALLVATILGLLVLAVSSGSIAKPLVVPAVAAICLGILTPMAVIALRHQVRVTRIRLINLFEEAFELKNTRNISFEFVRGKYFVDLMDGEGTTQLPRYPFSTGTDWLLLVSAVPMMGFSTMGVFLLLAPFDAFGAPPADGKGTAGAIGQYLWPSLLAIGGLDLSKAAYGGCSIERYYHREFVLIAALAFAGAYIYTLRLQLRAVTAFDMNSVTFLRAFVHMVLASLLAVVIWRTSTQAYSHFLSGDVGTLPVCRTDGNRAPDPPGMVTSPLWLFVAFAIGFVPDAGLQWVLQKARVDFKPRVSQFDKRCRTIPLTLIDGVDVFVAFRLEEANLFDVQNLATANPIMLHIETPYGIYSTIDWVAQAQLCTIVGPERFLFLKRIHIRTIFDLERALLGPGAESKFRRLVILTLMVGDRERAAIEREIGLKGFPREPTGTERGAVDGPALMSIDDLLPDWVDDNFVKHVATVIVDDLHVRRLRQVWNHIVDKLGPESETIRTMASPRDFAAGGRTT